jgi:hypothetical protein
MRSALVALLTCGACYEPPLCDPELKLDTTYVATVSEIYNQQSSALYDSRFAQPELAVAGWSSCAGFDGLIPGATISVKTTRATNDGSCKALSGVVLGLPNGEKWEENFVDRVGGGFGSYTIFSTDGGVVSGPCQGPYSITFGRPDKKVSVFSTASSGELPSMVLGRSFRPTDGDAGSKCNLCGDTFVAQLSLGK